MRRTVPLVKVCTAMLEQPGRQWGYDIGKRSGVQSGVLYPILARMVAAGWLRSDWSDDGGTGPRRRYYEVANEAAMREMVQS